MSSRTMPAFRRGLVTIATAAVLAAAGAAYASDVSQEISTAAAHAGYATQADKVDTVHLHLHHVVNCLVGKNGMGFDAAAGDPCNGMGNGAINDATSATQKAALEKIRMRAEEGLKTDQLDQAKTAASEVESLLKSAM